MWAHVASQLVVQLDTIVSRRVDPAESAVLSVTRLAGGSSHNVLPAGATLTGTARCAASTATTPRR
jgi:hippurate hydrolase